MRDFGRLRQDARVSLAERSLREDDERTLQVQIELSEIPAPPFDEGARARRIAEVLGGVGLTGVEIDAVGNVLGTRPGRAPEPPLIVSAHLDTVFPEGTDVRVTRRGDLLRGPGISDDARGLASLVAIARALDAARIRTHSPLLFVATVGEEGRGDLRGVKHLFEAGAGRRAGGFISLDGAGVKRIVTRGLGSRRFRIVARGPGGHSWVDWGTPNPIHALGRLAARLTELPLARTPPATLTIARWGGGTSINAIPQEAWLEIDTRCESDELLTALDVEIRRTVADMATSEPSALELTLETIGRRPGGETPSDSALVQAAVAATRTLCPEPELALSSTDANIPMAHGVPAITLGCGGEAGKAHTTEEWFRNVRGADGIIRALHTILLVAGVDAD